jgi:hypothetical protein
MYVSLIEEIAYLDELSWEALNDGSDIIEYVGKYHQRFSFPKIPFGRQNVLQTPEPDSPQREKYQSSGQANWKAIGSAKSPDFDT